LKLSANIRLNDENEFEFEEDLTKVNVIPLKHCRYL